MNIDIRQGDVLDVLRTMPSESVHCVITSPPYFGLRDYGTALWDGGDAECDHKGPPKATQAGFNERYFGKPSEATDKQAELASPYGRTCGKCGATRIDKQIGLEDTPDAYLQRMVEVFREVRRVLRSDGTCWVNMGDSYAQTSLRHRRDQADADWSKSYGHVSNHFSTAVGGMKPKDLLMMPARLALALQASGWWLRSDIIWCKRAPMPESVTDRPTSAHEHIFLLTKAARYFYDADAVRENVGQTTRIASKMRSSNYLNNNAFENSSDVGGWNGQYSETTSDAGRNLWNYWLLSPEPYPEAHFATFPTEIPRRCIKAGTSEWGCCSECGAPYRRVIERVPTDAPASYNGSTFTNGKTAVPHANVGQGARYERGDAVSWAPTCAHTSAPVVPATVLDIVNGSGTTGLVALELGRNYIGVELNPAYVELTRKRLMQEMPLFAYQALEGAA